MRLELQSRVEGAHDGSRTVDAVNTNLGANVGSVGPSVRALHSPPENWIRPCSPYLRSRIRSCQSDRRVARNVTADRSMPFFRKRGTQDDQGEQSRSPLPKTMIPNHQVRFALNAPATPAAAPIANMREDDHAHDSTIPQTRAPENPQPPGTFMDTTSLSVITPRAHSAPTGEQRHAVHPAC